MQPSVRVEDLVKRYGARDAVRGISFEVEPGEVVALLGPNGAGKTSTIEILEGYRPRDGGHAEVLGLDPGRGGRELRERIGIVLQGTSTHPHLSALEAVTLFAGYYRRPRDPRELISLVGLEESADQRVRTLSGGQRRRLDLALALAGTPELLFLDEPTTGFDPEARRRFWDLIRDLKSDGTTILLTTHYLDEAAQLGDRAAVLVDGRIAVSGSIDDLGGAGRRVPSVHWREDGRPNELRTERPGAVVAELVARLGGEPDDLEIRRPSLEDIYLELVGAGSAEEALS